MNEPTRQRAADAQEEYGRHWDDCDSCRVGRRCVQGAALKTASLELADLARRNEDALTRFCGHGRR